VKITSNDNIFGYFWLLGTYTTDFDDPIRMEEGPGHNHCGCAWSYGYTHTAETHTQHTHNEWRIKDAILLYNCV